MAVEPLGCMPYVISYYFIVSRGAVTAILREALTAPLAQFKQLVSAVGLPGSALSVEEQPACLRSAWQDPKSRQTWRQQATRTRYTNQHVYGAKWRPVSSRSS
jgi:hypothetical protein